MTRFEPRCEFSNDLDFLIYSDQDAKLINAGQYKMEVKGWLMPWKAYLEELDYEAYEDELNEQLYNEIMG